MALEIINQQPFTLRINASKEDVEANFNVSVYYQLGATGERTYLVYPLAQFVDLSHTGTFGARLRWKAHDGNTYTITNFTALSLPAAAITNIIIDNASKGGGE